ncbi:MAG: diguanylate cyclase [Candidatus Omnitrophota bacterium]
MEKKEKVLIVDNDQAVADLLKRALEHGGYEVHMARNGKQALLQVDEVRPGLILLDVVMPGMDGLEVKAKLNQKEATAGIPVIFLTGKGETHDKVEGLRLGADDYVTKPFEISELLARVKAALDRRRFYQKISTTDPLTGLHNQHLYQRELEMLFQIAKRYGRVFSLAVIDIDNLKTINDSLGHQAGDFVIKKTAEIMTRIFRKADFLIRYGGDEFVILLPESGEEQAAVAVDRLKAEIEGKEFFAEVVCKKISFSVSGGVASYQGEMTEPVELFELADRKMYQEKSGKKSDLRRSPL